MEDTTSNTIKPTYYSQHREAVKEYSRKRYARLKAARDPSKPKQAKQRKDDIIIGLINTINEQLTIILKLQNQNQGVQQHENI